MLKLLEDTLFTVSKVPGLNFLEAYVIQIREKKGRVGQAVGDLEAQKKNAVDGAKAVGGLPKNVKGSKKKR